MHTLLPGTVLRCIDADTADKPRNYQVEVDDLVVVVRQSGTYHGDTTMLSLTTGVFFRCEYSLGCIYDLLEAEACYEVYEP